MDKEILMQLLIMQNPQLASILEMLNSSPAGKEEKPKKRKVSAYSRRYGAAYRRIRKRHTLKNGKYRKGWNHKKVVKAAHKEAKRGGKK